MSYKKSLYVKKLKIALLKIAKYPITYWRASKTHKVICSVIIFLIIVISAMWGIGEWYIISQNNIPMTYGVTFVPDYAQSLGVNPKQTMAALIGIGVRQFRLTSYWSDIEPEPNKYNFSQLNWEFKMADAAHAKVILTVGLRQPRWPECHPPNWVNTANKMSTWEPQLLQFMSKVINRYKNNPALQAYQLENEYFLKGFGDCNNYSRARLIAEYNLLTKLDPGKPIIVGRSNNALGIPINKPTPSLYSISVYRRVWDATITHRYLEYPWPAWYYGFLAGLQELYSHRNMIIAEMQAEAWAPDGKTLTQISLHQQDKSINATRLKRRFVFSRETGMKDVIMWGAEYWYYRKVVLHDPTMWNVAKEEFKLNDHHDGQYLMTHLSS